MADRARSLAAKALVLTCWAAFAAPRAARADEVEQEFQLWTPIILNVDVVPDRLAAYLEVQVRMFDDARRVGQLVVRPALAFSVNEHLSLWLGYDRVETYVRDYQAENVLWEQVLIEHEVGTSPGLQLAYRVRLEQRFVRHEDPVLHRLRVMVRAALPVAFGGRLQAVIWDEAFVQLNEARFRTGTGNQVARDGFDHNRFFVGPGVVLVEDHAWVEVGYANLFFNRQGGDDLMAHALWITLRFDL